MELKGVLRLSLATSLLFALLGGASVTATAADPLVVPAPATIAAPAFVTVDEAPAVGPESSIVTASPVTTPHLAAPLPTADTPAPPPRLHSQLSGAAAGPRAPPAAA
ncbi:hypothetical protein AB0M36_33675 [Actinoplanes sp. NPDC051346]|uniref:hypothetical protein n=1 Tax=Actinoplanes sp. NPDC051346 TaxID=3155048 RepID=UPI0034358460